MYIFFRSVRKSVKRISRGRVAYSKGMNIKKFERCSQTALQKGFTSEGSRGGRVSPTLSWTMRVGLFSLGVNLMLTCPPQTPAEARGVHTLVSSVDFLLHVPSSILPVICRCPFWVRILFTCQVCCKHFPSLLSFIFAYDVFSLEIY